MIKSARVRQVPRTQFAEYAGGSAKTGYFEYTVHGYEEQGPSRKTVELRGRGDTRDGAIKATWAAARAWVSEIGVLVHTDKYLTATQSEVF
jgi:hypothetical protein